jgi:hypothetical protein
LTAGFSASSFVSSLRECTRIQMSMTSFTGKGQRIVYSTNKTYEMLCLGSITCNMYKTIWKSFATPKCKLFCWLALRYRLETSDRRHRHEATEVISMVDSRDRCLAVLLIADQCKKENIAISFFFRWKTS